MSATAGKRRRIRMFEGKAEEYAKIVLEESHKMSYDDFCREQISRKGYVCPANIWNPDLYEKSAAEICPDCEHYNNDCIVYGKKKGRWKHEKEQREND